MDKIKELYNQQNRRVANGHFLKTRNHLDVVINTSALESAIDVLKKAGHTVLGVEYEPHSGRYVVVSNSRNNTIKVFEVVPCIAGEWIGKLIQPTTDEGEFYFRIAKKFVPNLQFKEEDYTPYFYNVQMDRS